MEYGERKAKTHRGRKHLEKYQPKLEEGIRRALLTLGSKTSELSLQALGFFTRLLRSRATKLNARYETRPFEDDQLVLRLSEKHQCPLFFLASSSKKRPHRLTIGRVFDSRLLELIELQVQTLKGNFTALSTIAANQQIVFIALGDVFENDDRMRRLRNIFHDVFCNSTPAVNIKENLGFVVTLVGLDEKRVLLKLYERRGGQLTNIDLEIELSLERSQICDNDIFEEACKQPKKVKKVKNLEHNTLGQKMGRVHVTQQDLKTLRLKKIRKPKKEVPNKETGGTS